MNSIPDAPSGPGRARWFHRREVARQLGCNFAFSTFSTFSALVTAYLVCHVGWLHAEDAAAKDKTKAPAPPILQLPLPLGMITGRTNRMIVRGQRLKDLQSMHWIGVTNAPAIQLLKAEDTKVPDGSSAAKAGDQQIEILCALPEGNPTGTNQALVAISPAGESPPLPVLILAPAQLIEEQEPNDGFKQAQLIAPGHTVRGLLGDGVDVDVFQIMGQRGHSLRAEVIANRLGSTLDSSLALYDAQGTVLASNDDSEAGSDALLTAKFPADGKYYLALSSVNEKPSKTHAYLLQVSETP